MTDTSVGLILPAAGRGQRFGGPQPKQLCLIAGVPIWILALRPFHRLVDAIVIVCGSELEAQLQAQAAEHLPGWPLRFCRGGARRQDSVHAGLRLLADTCQRCLVHDAARPLIQPTTIQHCLGILDRFQACVVAQPCAATIKRSQGCDDLLVRATEDRSRFWLAETPQGFHTAPALAAFAAAESRGLNATDDSQILEAAGITVRLVPHTSPNPKITWDGDLALAQALLMNGPRRPSLPLMW